MTKLPLEGIRVADFTWALSGPYSMEWLSLMGAEVIRIESTLRPDTLRTNPMTTTGVEAGLNRAAGYNCLNYGKKSCTINLGTEKGIELAKQIISISDIVSNSFAYGVMERHGLGYEDIKKIKPDIIAFSKNTMGVHGRERHLFGWGTAVISYAGLVSVTGYEDVDMPQMIGAAWPDYTLGNYSPLPILAALYYRKKTGQGIFIDYAMCDAVITMIPEAIMDYTMNGRVQGPRGNKDERFAPHDIYRCQGNDKWVAIAVQNDDQWRAFCQLMGHEEWAADERFADLFGRQYHKRELDSLISVWTSERTTDEVTRLLQAAGVPAGPVHNVEELTNDPHLRARDQFKEITHPEVGTTLAPGLPINLSAVPNLRYESAPLIGEHNQYVFSDLLGLDNNEIDRLIEEGVIV